MISSDFSVTVSATLGPRPGRLSLQTENGDITGSLALLGQENYFQGKLLRKNHYVVSFIWNLSGEALECDMLLAVRENLLSGVIVSSRGCWEVEGTRLDGDAQSKM